MSKDQDIRSKLEILHISAAKLQMVALRLYKSVSTLDIKCGVGLIDEEKLSADNIDSLAESIFEARIVLDNACIELTKLMPQ